MTDDDLCIADSLKLIGLSCFSTMIVFLIADMLFRLQKWYNEYNSYRNHYSSTQDILKMTFSYTSATITMYVVIITFLGVIFSSIITFIETKHMCMLFGMAIGTFICFYVGVQKSDLNNAHWIRWEHNLDYGSGSAIGYFYGYLKIIGPATGTEKKGIVERIEIYEAKEHVSIPIKKLFIFIPKDFFIPPQLSLVNSDSYNARQLKMASSLESLYIDRAGVKGREYGNTVYRLCNKEKWYVCIEGATPVYTMMEVLNNNSDIAKMKHEILQRFCMTLQLLINSNADTRHLFELIVFDNNDNLVEILEKRIRELLGQGDNYQDSASK